MLSAIVIRCKYICIALFLVLVSCKTDINIEKLELSPPTISVDNFNDSLYLGHVVRLSENNSELYLLDMTPDKIVVLDTNLNYKRTIGRRGRGSNEFIEATSFFIFEDSVLVKDPAGRRFQIYNKMGKHLSSYSYSDFPVGISSRFAFKNNCIINSASKDSSFIKMDLDQETKYKLIGKRIFFENETQARVRNDGSFFYFKDRIISISDNLPIIKVYDQDYNIVEEYNYQMIDFVDQQMKHSEDKINKSNSYYRIVRDCYMYNNKIFLLISENNPKVKFTVNKIIEFEINENIKFNRILLLPGKIYSTFSVRGKDLFAFNGNNRSIEKIYIK